MKSSVWIFHALFLVSIAQPVFAVAGEINDDEADIPRNVIILNQGYDSCKPELSRENPFFKIQLIRLKSILSQKNGVQKSKIIHSCFGRSEQFQLDYWVDDEVGKNSASTVDSFVELVQKEISHAATRQVVVVGHSHGGWLAMKMISGLDRRVQVDHLVTIDPISYQLCQPAVLTNSILGSVFGRKKVDVSCTSVTDEMKLMTNDVRGKVNFWQQHYETTTAYLHSEPIPEADENFLYEFPNYSSWNYEPHIQVRERSELWQRIFAHWN